MKINKLFYLSILIKVASINIGITKVNENGTNVCDQKRLIPDDSTECQVQRLEFNDTSLNCVVISKSQEDSLDDGLNVCSICFNKFEKLNDLTMDFEAFLKKESNFLKVPESNSKKSDILYIGNNAN